MPKTLASGNIRFINVHIRRDSVGRKCLLDARLMFVTSVHILSLDEMLSIDVASWDDNGYDATLGCF